MRFEILTEPLEKGKGMPDLPKDIFFFILAASLGVGGFTAGKISTIQDQAHSALKLTASGTEIPVPAVAPMTAAADALQTQGPITRVARKYVASKTGTTYHLPWCSGAKRIKEENKVWFEDKEEAERAGYHPAANCKGI